MSAQTLAKNLNEFALKIYKQLGSDSNENFFMSPYSISSALTMCLIGAKGDTAKELKTLLALDNFKNDDEIHEACREYLSSLKQVVASDISLNLANKIFPNDDFVLNEDFGEKLLKHFGASVQQLNYKTEATKSTQTINDWVSHETKDKIKDLIPQGTLNDLTRLVLVNAIYFKGNWTNKFDSAKTEDSDFTKLDGSVVKVPTMKLYNSKFKFNYTPFKASTCEFPYNGDKVSMMVILPDQESNVNELESSLNGASIHQLLEESQNSHKIKVMVHLPKFKFEHKTELSKHLVALGAPSAFDEMKADFSGINSDSKGNLSISKVIHQAVIEVNEEGSEAAAATAAVMQSRRMEIPTDFHCDRPFIFVIFEKQTNGILFIGKYVQP